MIEVFSPYERAVTMLSRVSMLLRAGTQLVWIVDPVTQIVTAFDQRRPLWTVGKGDELDGGEVLPGFHVPVAEVFE